MEKHFRNFKTQAHRALGAGTAIVLDGCVYGRQAKLLCCLFFPCLVLTLCSLMNPDETAPQFSQNLSCEV